MKRRILGALLTLCFLPIAVAENPVIQAVLTTSDDMSEPYVICPCDGATQTLFLWATVSYQPEYIPIPIGSFVFSFADGGDHTWVRNFLLDDGWKIEGAGWTEDETLIAWAKMNSDGRSLNQWEWTLIGTLDVTVWTNCNRGVETDTDLLGWMMTPELDWLDVQIGPGNPVRELTPDCGLPSAVCPSRRAYCWWNPDCRDNYPARNKTCGECGSNPDCPPFEWCICGVCEPPPE